MSKYVRDENQPEAETNMLSYFFFFEKIYFQVWRQLFPMMLDEW